MAQSGQAQRRVALVGGGVIGGGWAARFLLHGWEVRVFDPDPRAQARVHEIIAHGRRSLPALGDVMLPAEGALQFAPTLAAAVSEAEWIQESVPERLELKQRVLQEIEATCPPEAIVASSTSGFVPRVLQQGARHPGRILVAHPFNPVYLLPLVEVVATPANDPALLTHACAVLTGLGMFPLCLDKEIEAHIADRLLEAVWREALWLIQDDVATTAQIDAAICLGFGLRWAQMGLFDTYRLAGGPGGMRHFIAQFGPALKWPWTRLMEVPELTDALMDKIANQSDAQSGHMDRATMERRRDDTLVALMRALKARDVAAGAVLNRHDAALARAAGVVRHIDQIGDLARPIPTLQRVVPTDWLDYNGHMTESRYLQAFAEATDGFMEIIGCDRAYIAAGGSYFTAETHLRHLAEVQAGQSIAVHTQLLAGEGSKLHLWHEMHAGGVLLATGEHFLLHVSLDTRKSSPPAARLADNIARLARAHGALPVPVGAGRRVGDNARPQ